jgi:ABC-type nitrate/sulfonate/bicarbonate transport system ATPase subunit
MTHRVDSPRAGTSNPAVSVENVTATYRENGRTLIALEGISLAVGRGEFVAVIGPSGSGKSTLLDIIAGLVEPDTGVIRLDSVPLPAASRLGRTAYMHQRDLLLPWRTVRENAALGMEVLGQPKRQALHLADERLAEFGLDRFASAWPAQLSGGMRQRVAFLRTILPGLPVLLLDEPFGALDALTRAELQEWLLQRWEQERQAVLLVTHDVDEAILLADRVLVFSARPGRIADEVRIDLPRPRHRSIVTDPAFIAYKASILAHLERCR